MRWVRLERHVDQRGELIVANPPFHVQRAFWIVNAPYGRIRGAHAHRVQHQLLVAVTGSVRLYARSLDGKDGDVGGTLTNPSVGFHAAPGTYLELSRFTPDACVLVLASGPYDESDYIRP